jgi:hypothetical protein
MLKNYLTESDGPVPFPVQTDSRTNELIWVGPGDLRFLQVKTTLLGCSKYLLNDVWNCELKKDNAEA